MVNQSTVNTYVKSFAPGMVPSWWPIVTGAWGYHEGLITDKGTRFGYELTRGGSDGWGRAEISGIRLNVTKFSLENLQLPGNQ